MRFTGFLELVRLNDIRGSDDVAPQHVSVDVNAPWRQLMAQAIVASVDGPGADDEVVDGEVVEDSD